VHRRLISLAITALAAGLVGGCASGKVREANDYVKAVNAAQTTFAQTSNRLRVAIAPDNTKAQNQVVLQRFYGAVDVFVARLRAITPPARVRALHDRLITAMVRFGASLRSAGAGMTSKSASRILDGQAQLATATADASRAIDTTIAQINRSLRSG
jgi:predicted phage tail protein